MRRGYATDAGTTLVEVLLAIFVMGIGLLALLTLFPLGAQEMAQVIKDDRTAAIADNARIFGDTGKDCCRERPISSSSRCQTGRSIPW
jgi:hypothetical protein